MIKLEDVLTLANVKNLTTLIKEYVDNRISALSTSVSEIFGEVDTSLDSLETDKAEKTDLTSHTRNKENPHVVTKTQIGLGNVENKNSATIRGEITKANVTNALGYTPPTSDTDTKNTAGSTNSSSKLFLIGATSQGVNPQTYSHDTAYVGTDGCLYSNNKKAMTVDQLLSFSNISVPTSAWASDTTYLAYPYRATLSCSGVTTSHSAEVDFNLTEAVSGNFAPVTATGANVVYIYAMTKPTATITIPTVIARKAVS